MVGGMPASFHHLSAYLRSCARVAPARPHDQRVALIGCETSDSAERARVDVVLSVDGRKHVSTHTGVGPVEALISSLAAQGIVVDVLGLHQAGVGTSRDSEALSLIEHRAGGDVVWTAGRGRSVLAATLSAVMAAAARVPESPELASTR